MIKSIIIGGIMKLKINEDNYQKRYFTAYLEDNGELTTHNQPEEGYSEAEVVKVAYESILDDITTYGASIDEAFDNMHIIDDMSNPCTALDNKVHSMILNRKGFTKADPYELALKYFDEAYTDKEVAADLNGKGYSYDFIQQVFDYLEDIYEDSVNY